MTVPSVTPARPLPPAQPDRCPKCDNSGVQSFLHLTPQEVVVSSELCRCSGGKA